jgi:hypothetical protein
MGESKSSTHEISSKMLFGFWRKKITATNSVFATLEKSPVWLLPSVLYEDSTWEGHGFSLHHQIKEVFFSSHLLLCFQEHLMQLTTFSFLNSSCGLYANPFLLFLHQSQWSSSKFFASYFFLHEL